MVMDGLCRLGYSPELDEDGDVGFMFQMKAVYVAIGDQDDQFLSVVYPFMSIISEDKSAAVAMATCNQLTRSLKLIKTTVAPEMDRVDATVEFYYYDENSLLQNLEHALKVLGCVGSIYRRTEKELMSDNPD